MLKFKKVSTAQEINITAKLAKEIWTDHFVNIIGQEQTDYMIENFQSEKAMTEQIKSGYEYYNFIVNGEVVGYFAIRQQDDNTLFLSKLYLKKSYRGNGYARQAFDYIKDIAKRNSNTMVWLTVNKYNDNTIAVYKKIGMQLLCSQVTDIGNGFVMDDYVFGYQIK